MSNIIHSAYPRSEFISGKHCFSRKELEGCADGLLFGKGNAQLPAPPLLMIDRIMDIQSSGGEFDRGYVIAELDIQPEKWFFKHHFVGDPIMPGCLLIESFWQLTGFHMAWSGYKGKGRVLDSGRTKFLEPVTTRCQKLSISVQIRKVITNKNPIYISNGKIQNEIAVLCQSDAIKVGLFE